MSFTINSAKESATPGKPVLLAEFTFSDASVFRAATIDCTYGGNTYEPVLTEQNLAQISTLSEQGIDRTPTASLQIADPGASLFTTWERGSGKGFRGATLVLRFAVYDVVTGEWSTDSLIPFIGVCGQPSATAEGMTVEAQNKLNLTVLQLPSVPICARCPWANPVTDAQRAEAADPNSRFYRCGETRDLVTAPPCSFTRQTCTQPLHFGGSTWVAKRITDEGTEYVSGAKVAWTNPDTSGKYREFWPEWLGGSAWVEIPVLNQWADANYTRGEAAVGVDEIEVLRVIANNVELSQSMSGDYRWHYVNNGARDGAHNVDVGYADGDPYGNQTVIQFLAPHATIDPNSIASIRVLAQTRSSSASLAVVSTSASDGPIRVDFGGPAPADGPGDGSLVTIIGNSWGAANISAIIRYYDSPATDHAYLEGTLANGSGTGGTLYYKSNVIGSGGAVPTPTALQEAYRASGRFSDADLGTSWGAAVSLAAETIQKTDGDGNEVPQQRFTSAMALKDRRSVAEIVRGLRSSMGARIYIGPDGKLEIGVEGPLAEQQPSAVDGSNDTDPVESTLRDGSSADGYVAYSFDESNSKNLKRTSSGSNSTTPNKVTFPFSDPANDWAVSTFSELDPEDVSRMDQETAGGLQVQPEGIASYNHAYRVARLGLAKVLRGNPAGDTRGTDWWEWEPQGIRGVRLQVGQIVRLADPDLLPTPVLVRLTSIRPTGKNLQSMVLTAHHHEDPWYLDTLSTLTDPERTYYHFPYPIVSPPLGITFAGSAALQGQAYAGSLVATGGTSPYTYSISVGALPAGLALDAATGAITGTPTTSGRVTFTGRVQDAKGLAQTIVCTIAVALPNGSGVDATVSFTSTPSDNTGARWSDPAQHAVINAPIALTAYPRPVTFWAGPHGGTRTWRGVWTIAASGTIQIGAQNSNSLVYPPTVADETWEVVAAVGSYAPADAIPSGAVTSATFTLHAPGVYGSTGSSSASAATTTEIETTGGAKSILVEFDFGLPLADPDFFFARVTVQSGRYVGGVWTPGGANPGTTYEGVTGTPIGDWAGPTYSGYTASDHSPAFALKLGTINSSGLTTIHATFGPYNIPTDSNNILKYRLYIATRKDDGSGGTKTQQATFPGSVNEYDVTLDTTKGKVAGSKVSGSVPSADAAPWSGITGGINTGGGAAGQVIQQFLDAAGAVVAWIGKKTISAVDYYGLWVKNLWVGGTDPTNPKFWVDGSGNVHMVGSIENGSSITVGTALGTVTISAANNGVDIVSGSNAVHLFPGNLSTVDATGSSVVTPGTADLSYGKIHTNNQGVMTKYANVLTAGVGLHAEVYNYSANSQTLSNGASGMWQNFSGLVGEFEVLVSITTNYVSGVAAGNVLPIVNAAFSGLEGYKYPYDPSIGAFTAYSAGAAISGYYPIIVKCDGAAGSPSGLSGIWVTYQCSQTWANASFNVRIRIRRIG